MTQISNFSISALNANECIAEDINLIFLKWQSNETLYEHLSSCVVYICNIKKRRESLFQCEFIYAGRIYFPIFRFSHSHCHYNHSDAIISHNQHFNRHFDTVLFMFVNDAAIFQAMKLGKIHFYHLTEDESMLLAKKQKHIFTAHTNKTFVAISTITSKIKTTLNVKFVNAAKLIKCTRCALFIFAHLWNGLSRWICVCFEKGFYSAWSANENID